MIFLRFYQTFYWGLGGWENSKNIQYWYLLSLMHQTLLSFNTPTFISLTHTNLLFFPIFSYRFSIFPCELIIYTWIKTYWICRAIARRKLPNKNNKFLGSSALRSIINYLVDHAVDESTVWSTNQFYIFEVFLCGVGGSYCGGVARGSGS